mmetsp:Transcript_22586/g.68881  ORF Transcript_22586/g.68881 Transcript_22586/m.68881 type:complete len:374 (-) Transcript_22586:295-1416(-)
MSSSSASAGATRAASTIAGYVKCMRARRATPLPAQPCEMLLVSRLDGQLTIEDFGGWAGRNPSMARMLRQLDEAAMLDDFAPLLVQTGDRCVAKLTEGRAVELHLWQLQPVPQELQQRIPLHRVLSMCGTPRYADVPIPDWCFDAWPEAGVSQGAFDDVCAELASAGASPPTDGKVLSWCGTAHHHPSRLKLLELAAQFPSRMAVNDVVDRSLDVHGTCAAKYRSLGEQVRRCAYLLDIQGMGYSSRLKLLLHSGRPIFIVARPWQEYYSRSLEPYRHFIPVKEDLSDLINRLDWADAHPQEVADIGKTGQAFARDHLNHAAALIALANVISSLKERDAIEKCETGQSRIQGNDADETLAIRPPYKHARESIM